MKFFCFILLILFFSIKCVENEESTELFPIENGIIILTDSTFEKAISKYENILIAFYSPLCGYCIKLIPELEKASKTLLNENIKIAKVDATKEKHISFQYKILSYPTIKFFKENTSIQYSGKRKEEDLILWARKKASLSVSYLKTIDDIEKIKKENKICIIYFGKEEKDIKIIKTLAVKFEDLPFAIVEDEKLTQLYKVVFNSVVIFKKFDEKRNDIINFNEQKLENFIKKYSE